MATAPHSTWTRREAIRWLVHSIYERGLSTCAEMSQGDAMRVMLSVDADVHDAGERVAIPESHLLEAMVHKFAGLLTLRARMCAMRVWLNADLRYQQKQLRTDRCVSLLTRRNDPFAREIMTGWDVDRQVQRNRIEQIEEDLQHLDQATGIDDELRRTIDGEVQVRAVHHANEHTSELVRLGKTY